MIKIGDEIMYRPSWGSGPLTLVCVEHMSVTVEPRSKYGDDVEEVTWDLIEENRVVFCLDNGKWAYSDQVDLDATKRLH